VRQARLVSADTHYITTTNVTTSTFTFNASFSKSGAGEAGQAASRACMLLQAGVSLL
jgi:hypothetical protein